MVLLWGSSSLGCHQKSLVFQLVWAKDEPTGKPRKISGFIREFDLDESEFASPANTFASFNEFFSRKLKAGARPICNEPETLAFPADGRHLGSRIWLKLHPFSSRAKDLTWPAFFNPKNWPSPMKGVPSSSAGSAPWITIGFIFQFTAMYPSQS